MKVVWTEEAARRLGEIEDFIASRSPAAGVALSERILSRADALARFPERGRRLPEIPGSAIREVLEGNYRIVYRVRSKTVEVLTVFEGHRLLRGEDLPRDAGD